MFSTAWLVRRRGYILTLLFLILLALSSHHSFRFKTMAVLTEGLPSDLSQYRVKGDANNIIISANSVEIRPMSLQRSNVQMRYKLDNSTASGQLISIVGDIKSTTDMSVTASGSDGLKESLFYTWFVDGQGERMQVRILSKLEELDRRFESSGFVQIPEGAEYLAVALLQRKFSASHALLDLQIKQIERTQVYLIALCLLGLVAVSAVVLCSIDSGGRFALG